MGLLLEPGQVSVCQDVGIVDDAVFEGLEHFEVMFDFPVTHPRLQYGAVRTAVVTIEDNDSKEWREGGREGGRQAGRQAEREGGREGGRKRETKGGMRERERVKERKRGIEERREGKRRSGNEKEKMCVCVRERE